MFVPFPRALAEVPRSDELLFERRDALHLPGLRAAVRLPLPEAALRAQRTHRRGGRPPPLSRQGRQRARRRRAGRPGRRNRVRCPDQAGHQVRAASGIREECERRIRLSQHEARGRRRQVQGDGFQGDRDARARRRRLRLCDPPPRDAAHQVAGVLADVRLHRRLEGIRREDRRDRQGVAQGPRADRSRSADARLPPVFVRGRRGDRSPYASHPRDRQVPAVQVLARDDVLRARPVGGREVLRAAGNGGKEPDAQLLAGRHRSLHVDRVPGEPAARPRAQSELPRRALSVRGRARRQGKRLSRRLRQGAPVRRQDRVRHREGRRAAQGEIPAGLLRLAGDRAPRLRDRL